MQSLFSGNITFYTYLCEQARLETYERMCQQAEQRGASAIIAMHYDATEVIAGLTEALCCGTAVTVVREASEVQVSLGVETGCKL